MGDATAGRERTLFVEDALRAAGVFVVVQGVSEAAAATWKASDAAKEELPEADPDTRSAVALACSSRIPCPSSPRSSRAASRMGRTSTRSRSVFS